MHIGEQLKLENILKALKLCGVTNKCHKFKTQIRKLRGLFFNFELFY